MSDTIHQTITTLEQEIEAIDQRRGDLQKAIDTLRPLVGAPAIARRRRRGPTRPNATKAQKRTNERTNERTKQDAIQEPP